MFCDELKLKLTAGKGGNGSISFLREKFISKGGPNGGDGGNGGNIIIRVNNNLNTLSHLSNQKVYHAESGENGKIKDMHGKNGEHLTIEVPEGTLVFKADKSEILADLEKKNSEIIIARGGKGGFGNAHFTSSIHQAPKFAETGEPGEELEIVLELKLVADVGIIGLPSAGKSTLISVISNAKPKIAAYHFTTLIPNLGVVNMSQFGGGREDSFVVTDIPGLIEGASQGKGLGHQFLKHITRTKLLIHLIDGYLENPDLSYKIINNELSAFDKMEIAKLSQSPKLAKLPQIIVLNKIDMLDKDTLKSRLKELKKVTKKAEVFTLSALTKEGLKQLFFEVHKQLQLLKKQKIKIREKAKKEQNDQSIPILKPHQDRVKFEIAGIIKEKEYKTFEIIGKRIEQVTVMTDTTNPQGLERMYHFIERMGIKKAIEKQGATYGDLIKIRGKFIPYRK